MKLSSLFSSKSSGLVGVDISSRQLRIVELGGKSYSDIVLQHCVTEPLIHGAVIDDVIEKIDDVADSLRTALNKHSITTKNVAFALPRSTVITQKVTMPTGLSEDEIESQVIEESAQYIPFPLDEVAIDFYVMGQSRTSPGDVDVMVAATRKSKVDDLEDLAADLGLNAKVVDVRSFATKLSAQRLIEHLPGRSRNMAVGLFSIEDENTSFIVYIDDEVVHERDHSFGTGVLTATIARNYGLSIEEAEDKRKAGDLPDNFESEIMEPFIQSIGQDTSIAVGQALRSLEKKSLDYLMVCGTSNILPRTIEAISSHSGISTALANPFQGMRFSSSISSKRLQKDAPAFMTSCGLALRKYFLYDIN